ncbi:hypothetical protein FGIG_10731 [Fasciola gigantica]|uniref:UPF0506 domain-containing protein n=1 Tax=Fasciola gigantica TaxID=46835 RepID=A0A504Z3N3_FASGI|nr:hypothetical protein FGIG_10731 [Fasciola gigantica]
MYSILWLVVLLTNVHFIVNALDVHKSQPCGQLKQPCSRFVRDRKPCCWPNKCQQVDKDKGICVNCIVTNEFCIDNSECCSNRCEGYLCREN